MVDKNNNFLSQIKVQNSLSSPGTPSSYKDRYICLKLMQDLSKIYNFQVNAQTRDENADNEKEVPSEASIHYYSINKQLGDIEYSFRQNEITSAQFSSSINKICTQYQIDLDHLIDITQSIDSLGRYPSHEQVSKLSQQLESEVLEYKQGLNKTKE